MQHFYKKCGFSSVGRAEASQASGRGFEPRNPLKFIFHYDLAQYNVAGFFFIAGIGFRLFFVGSQYTDHFDPSLNETIYNKIHPVHNSEDTSFDEIVFVFLYEMVGKPRIPLTLSAMNH